VTNGRLPDFIIIGMMKSATTTLFHWLDEQPGCFLASPKETDFFSEDARWNLGPGWYADLFRSAPANAIVGEASVSYTLPETAGIAAERMQRVLPSARLIAVLRHPIERMRSHYRHEVQRGRERRSFDDALRSSSNPYVAASRYFTCLQPYLDRFPREQLCLVRFDDLVAGEHGGWAQVLGFLGLEHRPVPNRAHNVTTDHQRWTRTMGRLQSMGVFRLGRPDRWPAPIRRLGKRVLMRDDEGYRDALHASDTTAIPDEVLRSVWADVERLDRWIGAAGPMWTGEAAAR
jgi:Sulfotransferase family